MSENHILQVMPEEERNPFRATVTSPPAEADFGNGYIRITPPVTVGEAMLENVGFEGYHDLDFWASSKVKGVAATVIAFAQKEEGAYMGESSGRKRIIETTQALLGELGHLVSDNS